MLTTTEKPTQAGPVSGLSVIALLDRIEIFLFGRRFGNKAGDFQRNVRNEGGTHMQAVIYLPYREVSRLRPLYDELIYAVATKHDDETRHETALRYITERENRVECPATSSPNSSSQRTRHPTPAHQPTEAPTQEQRPGSL